ncbi:YhcB family protein [Alkalimarinus alittae]|uniref:Z-ring associated protein G n=1 Tax=Alkalimarinus alittae TaxID=2961619 RepID=A0ABY6MZC0_9ALTE|nr:YhcB family protein [Alkalimarinus alittae]UZE95191.1 YhcB family protein [Alkalimarinus alittae]
MNEMENYVAIIIIAFLSGAILGVLIYRLVKGDGGRSKRVEQQMDDLQQKHTRYQAQVSDHFVQTAQLFNRLNDDYREIHNHLAKGATELCSEDNANNLLNLATQAPDAPVIDHHDDISEIEDMYAEPPRDYAPKSNNDKGTLSEAFGLKDKEEDKEKNKDA